MRLWKKHNYVSKTPWMSLTGDFLYSVVNRVWLWINQPDEKVVYNIYYLLLRMYFYPCINLLAFQCQPMSLSPSLRLLHVSGFPKKCWVIWYSLVILKFCGLYRQSSAERASYIALTRRNLCVRVYFHMLRLPYCRYLLMFTMENALVVALSQACRYLRDPTLDPRVKQFLKRELGSELVSFQLWT